METDNSKPVKGNRVSLGATFIAGTATTGMLFYITDQFLTSAMLGYGTAATVKALDYVWPTLR